MFSLDMLDCPMYSLSSSTWNFLCWMGWGDHSKSVLLFGFLCGTPPSCLKVMGWWVVVAYKILLSAPVPIGIGIRGLGLGLDNILVFLLFSFLSVIVTNKSNIHTHPFWNIFRNTHALSLIMFRLLLNLNIPFRSQSLEPAWVSSSGYNITQAESRAGSG